MSESWNDEHLTATCMSSMNYVKKNLKFKPMPKNIGVVSMGIKTPIIREGDDLADIVVNSVLDATRLGEKLVQPGVGVKGLVKLPGEYFYDINDRDVIGITESIVARAAGNYVTLDEIKNYIIDTYGQRDRIVIVNPIYSRNRFSMILKAIARAARKDVLIYMPEFDEVGNPSGINQFTGVNMIEYYTELVNKEDRGCVICDEEYDDGYRDEDDLVIYCGLHDYALWEEDYGDSNHITLANICCNKCEYLFHSSKMFLVINICD